MHKLSDAHKNFEKFIQTKGLKMTAQRKLILDYLLSSKDHLTPEDLYRNLSQKDNTLGRATVFRTLHLLQEAGLVGKIQLANGRAAFEHQVSKAHHDHMICVACSKVIEFCDPKIEELQEKITKKFGFVPSWHRHEIFGKCKSCQE